MDQYNFLLFSLPGIRQAMMDLNSSRDFPLVLWVSPFAFQQIYQPLDVIPRGLSRGR
jgi:hypothetical protein